jgi:hypothetical protein
MSHIFGFCLCSGDFRPLPEWGQKQSSLFYIICPIMRLDVQMANNISLYVMPFHSLSWPGQYEKYHELSD